MPSLLSRTLLVSSLALVAGVASAQSFVDGVRGAEWAGNTGKRVTYDANAIDPNAPTDVTPSNENVALDVLSRTDGTYFYGLIQTVPMGMGNDNADASLSLQFANVYFDIDLPNMDGSDVVFELGNNRVFNLNTGTAYNNISDFGIKSAFTAGTSYANGGAASTYEFAIPLSYFTTDPQNVGFVKAVPGDDVQFRTVQAYGYAFSGGSTFGATRFGQYPTPAQPVPEPASMAALGFGALALLKRRRKNG